MDILDFFWTFYLNHLSPIWGYFFLVLGLLVLVMSLGRDLAIAMKLELLLLDTNVPSCGRIFDMFLPDVRVNLRTGIGLCSNIRVT